MLFTPEIARPPARRGVHGGRVEPRDLAKLLASLYLPLLVLVVLLFKQMDVMYNAFVANQIALGHVDVYRYFSATPVLRSVDTVMPPLYYMVTAAYLKVLLVLHLDPVTTHRMDMFRVLYGHRGGGQFFAGEALIKFPNLVALGAGVLAIRRLALKIAGADELVMLILWLGSPILLTASVMQAQNDIIPASCTLAALAAFDRDKPWKTMLWLSLAAAFKNYALLLIPVTSIFLAQRDVRALIRLAGVGFLLPVVSALPFLGREFVVRVFFAHDGSSILTGLHLGSFHVSVFPVAYIFILWMVWRWTPSRFDIPTLAAMWLLTLSPIFVLSWWRFQWAVWLVPLAVVLAAKDRRLLWTWTAVNTLLLVNNLVNLSGNMDGAMLTPVFGSGSHAALSEVLYYDRVVPPLFRLIVHGLCYMGFLALALAAFARLEPERVRFWRPIPRIRLPGQKRTLALLGPAFLLVYMVAMVTQHLVDS